MERLKPQEELLREAHEAAAQAFANGVPNSYVAEWLLDNFYVIQQALRQVREDMPAQYYRQLPKLAGTDLAGYPRIYAVARRIIQDSNARIDLDQVRRFVAAYQDEMPLTMGELWALPISLRLGILDVLTQAVAQFLEKQPPSLARAAAIVLPADLPADTVVSNAILSLRTLAVEDWAVFFESLSRVDRILRQDPAQVYASMEFATRDDYRSVVEKLAVAAEHSEVAVAQAAVSLAARAATAAGSTEDRAAHVGYFLVAEGREELEAELGYRPSLWARLKRLPLRHPFITYQGSIGLLSVIILYFLIAHARGAGAGWLGIVMATLFALIPAITIAVSVVNYLITTLAPPRLLPKLDFSEGIPPAESGDGGDPCLAHQRRRSGFVAAPDRAALLAQCRPAPGFCLAHRLGGRAAGAFVGR